MMERIKQGVEFVRSSANAAIWLTWEQLRTINVKRYATQTISGPVSRKKWTLFCDDVSSVNDNVKYCIKITPLKKIRGPYATDRNIMKKDYTIPKIWRYVYDRLRYV